MYDDMTRFSSWNEDIEAVQFWAECKAEQEHENAQCNLKDNERW